MNSVYQLRAFLGGLLGGLGDKRVALFTLLRHGNSWSVLRRVGMLLGFAVGLWLCLRFVATLNLRQVAADVRRAGFGVAWLFAAPVVGNFVHMLGWRCLLPVPMRPAFGRAMAIFVTAQAGNELGAGVLGESFKVSVFAREQRAAAMRAVVLDNLTALVALFAVVLTIMAILGNMQHSLGTPMTIAGRGLLLSALLGGAYLGRRASAPIMAAFVAHYLGKLWIVAEFALALGLIAHASFRASAWLGLVATGASVLGAPIPGQLGVLETALASSAAWVGVGASTLVSVAVLRRARSLIWIALGALLFWRLTSAKIALRQPL